MDQVLSFVSVFTRRAGDDMQSFHQNDVAAAASDDAHR